MSEDDSMEDSLVEDELDDEDSSSESVDEEMKLTKNFIDALARIQVNKNSYDDYVLLVSPSFIYSISYLLNSYILG
jgi:hypothetical protein